MPSAKGTYTACSIRPQTLKDIHYLKAKVFDKGRVAKARKSKRPPESASSVPGFIAWLVEREMKRWQAAARLPF